MYHYEMKTRQHPKNKAKDKMGEKHSCKKKRRFRDLAEAKAAKSRIPTKMRVYDCNYCKGYHLTTKDLI
jgi:hypothetical protein